MDSSTRIEPTNFTNMKNFVAEAVSNFMIQANSTRVGLIQFATLATIKIALGSIGHIDQLKTAISGTNYTGVGERIFEAFNLVPAALINARVSEGIPSVVIALTDQIGNRAVEEAVKLHQQNIQIYSVGIGARIDGFEVDLQNTASDPNYVFRITNFSSSSFTDKLRPIWQTVCTSKF